VAIVGRPNVGKSTLFNRLVGGRAALVHDTPGVTRDRNEAIVRSGDREFVLVDTGGFEAESGSGIEGLVRRQSWEAASTADLTVFVLDGRAGLSPADREAVSLLRRSGQRVVYVVNKIDTPKQDVLVFDFSSLGVEPLIPVSAEHNIGIDELIAEVLERLPEPAAPPTPALSTDTRLALVGRPNVGKSSLLNRLAGMERSIVDETPGTTRDPVDTVVRLGARTYLLVDTAGIRRRSRIDQRLERLSVLRSLRTIERAEIVLVVVDAVEGMTDQDARIAAIARRRGRGLAFLVNKWDLRTADAIDEQSWLADTRERRPAFAETPTLCVSAVTGWHLDRLPRLVEGVERDFTAELPTPRVNQVLQHAVQSHSAPAVAGRTPRFYYATQVGTRPPTVAIFTSDPGGINAAYSRYLRGHFSRAFGIRGATVKLEFRARR
jgi:GTP-binding protein